MHCDYFFVFQIVFNHVAFYTHTHTQRKKTPEQKKKLQMTFEHRLTDVTGNGTKISMQFWYHITANMIPPFTSIPSIELRKLSLCALLTCFIGK